MGDLIWCVCVFQTKGLDEARQQEEDLLEVQSVPMRNYLMEHVMPTLTQGLIECCTARPQDPVDFLVIHPFFHTPSHQTSLGFDHDRDFWFVPFQAEFLLKNNPFNY